MAEEIKQATPKEGKVDLNKRVKVKMNENAPHHENGEETKCSQIVADKIVKNKWGSIVTILALFMVSFVASAQQTVFLKMQNAGVDSVTVTNTGTAFVTTQVASKSLAFTTTVNARIWKGSGTVAGTVTLQGSIDGVNFSTVKNAAYAVTATGTPTDITGAQSISFVLMNNPYQYYRLSYTGAGTMVAYLKGTVWSH